MITIRTLVGVVKLRGGFQRSELQSCLCPSGGRYLGDLPVGHVGKAGQNIPKVGIGIDASTPAAFDERVEDGAAVTGFGFPDKKPVLLSQSGRANGILDQVVVDFQAAI